MKSFVAFVTIAFFATSAVANNWKDPESKFDATKNFTSTSSITWTVVDNVQKSCEAESRRRGNGGFGYSVDACSFWDGSSCVIITGRKTTLHEIGHEMRHCFQGNYH
jgi:hypothetical protein